MVQSPLQMRASFVFNLETKVLESGGSVEKFIDQIAWSPVLSFHSLWWFGVQCHLLVLVHCVFTKKFCSTSSFLLLTSFLKMLNLFNTRVSQFELNYWNKWTFPRHSNLLKCTCVCVCVCIYVCCFNKTAYVNKINIVDIYACFIYLLTYTNFAMEMYMLEKYILIYPVYG